jgi:hypothetical protein
MKKKLIGYVLVILGAGMQIVSLAADFLGLGNDPFNIGWKQLTGAGVGLLVIFVGIWFLSTTKPKDIEKELPQEETFEEEPNEDNEEEEEVGLL